MLCQKFFIGNFISDFLKIFCCPKLLGVIDRTYRRGYL